MEDLFSRGSPTRRERSARCRLVAALAALSYSVLPAKAPADTIVFFNNCQTAFLDSEGVTSDTIVSRGYRFTYTRDKLFTGGTGQPIGRQVRIPWPQGVEAQAVTTPPPGVTDYKARIRIERVDGAVFDLPAFTAKLLANTFGAGGAIEIMPLVNGEDAFNDPLYFDVTGFYGQEFSYDTSANPWGSTALLVGYDTYKVALYVDFAFVALMLDSGVPGDQACCMPDFTCSDAQADSCVTLGGTPQGIDSTCACAACGPITPVPAASAWSLLALALVLLIGGTCILRANSATLGLSRPLISFVVVVFSVLMSPRPAESGPASHPRVPPGHNNRLATTVAAAPPITTQDLNSGLSPADLVTSLLGPGVAFSNVTFVGANTAAGTFAGGTDIIGFESGIMLSSGNIAFASGPNTQDDVSGVNAGLSDPDLEGLIPGYAPFDACILEFDFQCTGTQVIQFQYVFASEEYNEWVNSPFNDVFGFFLNGENIALVPGSAGTAVSVNNVNCDNPYNPPAGSFCHLFINNDCDDIPPGTFPCPGVRDIQMDGQIVVLTATGTLNPGVNHIKLALADAGDQVLDSNVFIRAQSFTCGEPAGACCDTGAQSCTDDVIQANCQGTGTEWTVGLACNQLVPPCSTVLDPGGTDCTNPIPIDSWPYVDVNTTSDKKNDYSDTCLGNYDNGRDVLYELTITSMQCVDIAVTGATAQDSWIGIVVDTVCPPGASCVAQATSQGSAATITDLILAPGTYYLMIDRWPQANDLLDFTLGITDCAGASTGACCNTANQLCTDDVLEPNCQGPGDVWSVGVACGDLDPPCAPEVDPIGQDCEFPIYVTSLPFDDVNTTADKKEDYSSTCLGVHDDGDDIIYQITLEDTRCIDITVAGATEVDHSIGFTVDDTCPPSPSCLAQASTTGTVASISDLILGFGTYYLMIDRQPDNEGFAILNYRLSIADCPAAFGACCLQDSQCAQLTEDDCLGASGLDWVMDVPCSPNPCLAGDADGDGDVDLADFALLWPCLTGPGGGPIGSECHVFDLDGDDDVDLSDTAALANGFTGS